MLVRSRRFAFALLCAATGLPGAAVAEAVRVDHVEAELIAERSALTPGAENWAALRLKPDAGWHTYWRNPGDSGIPTTLAWQLPAGVTAGDIVWPYPEHHVLGEVMNYGYGEETLHLVPITVTGNAGGNPVELRAEAKWLVCSDICIPGKADLKLQMVIDTQAPIAQRWQSAFAEARARVPKKVEWPARFAVDAKDFSLAATSPEILAADELEFFPFAKDLVNHAAPQRHARDRDGLRLSQNLSSFFVSAPATVDGVLVITDDEETRAYEIEAKPGDVAVVPATASVQAAPPPAAAPEAGPSLWLALMLAFLGGVILNLMPCVFPVLSLKALAVLEAHDGRERGQATAYTIGVIVSFVALAAVMLLLRAGGQALGWGFQLQSPVFVAALAYLFFVMGLALAGAAQIGARFMGIGQALTQSGGNAGAFFTGVLAALVASPCTAPFMGPALGFAVTQPAAIALLVFAMLGFGLAAPFLLMGFFPRLAGWLPRPGAWMETFKQLMAFPLFLTVAWLLSVIGDAGAIGWVCGGLVLIAFALWLGRFDSAFPRVLRIAAFIGAVALLAHPSLRASASTPAVAAMSGAEPYSEARLAQLRAEHRTIFVNFTADWCLTCKVNERAVFGRDSVRQAFADNNVAEMIGDWTRPDPVITEALARFNRSGVPLYLVYREGGEPQVLPQILTPDMLIAAVSKNVSSMKE